MVWLGQCDLAGDFFLQYNFVVVILVILAVSVSVSFVVVGLQQLD